MSYRKKLIEVALPLNAINEASSKEKSIRHGHPSTLHLWWSRKPLATARAVLFSSLVDDPSEHPEDFPTEKLQEEERERLFRLIEQLVLWENSNNHNVLAQAHAEIYRSTGGTLPSVFDPFAGGGSIPLEAQRLGLEARASDLNPVAVLINKALIEIPPNFAGYTPVNPDAKKTLLDSKWYGVLGLADDIRYYGNWMHKEAERRIGYLYPKVTLLKEYGGGEATVIAWLWVRTVKCPNPACGAQMPLTSKWWLSKKKNKETWAEPQVDHSIIPPIISYFIKTGKGEPQPGTVNRQGAKCLACGTSVPFDYIRNEGKARRMNAQLIAIVAEGQSGRVYLAPNEDHVTIAFQARPQNVPETDLPEQALGFRVQLYGMTRHQDLFTPRQLVALTTFSDLVQEARDKILDDAHTAGLFSDSVSLNDDTNAALAYANAVATYLGLGLSKIADYNCTNVTWSQNRDQAAHAFTKQAIAMVWDYAEINPFANAAGDLRVSLKGIADVLEKSLNISIHGSSRQSDAASASGPVNYCWGEALASNKSKAARG